MDNNVFSADVSRLRQWERLMGDITDITHNVVRDFESEVRSCMDWVGQDDSMAKELRPRDQKEREGATKTGTSLMEAIGGITTALNVNGNVIHGAQDDAYDAIKKKTGKH